MIYLAHFRKYASKLAITRYVHFFWGINQHRISFLIEQNGVVSQVFDTFKTSNHHEVVLKAL